jgi:TetR/AcrR family transcriptional regulator, cholesterol catabolism regulator
MLNSQTTRQGSGAGTNRREELLEAAARRFARSGFEGTSMRDIAGDVGMLAGSMYHHFRSKAEMIAAVYTRGVDQIAAAVDHALTETLDPWGRLEAACAAHLEALLAESPFAAVLTADLSRLTPELREQLVQLRDNYEQQFTALVEDVRLPADVDRRLLRFQLLGALNWTPTWFSRGGKAPGDIARSYVRALRRDE